MPANNKDLEQPEVMATPSINEMIISGPTWQAAHFLKPIISELANETRQRWLTLVLSEDDASNTKQWLKKAGINNNRIQVLNHKPSMDSFELTRKALASGTSHTVICWIRQLDRRELSTLERAAKSGQCQGLAIRHRMMA